MGLPVKTPNAEKAYSVPVRMPCFRTSDIEATMAGMIESVKPDANPYSTANTMIGAFEDAGSHRARLIFPEKDVQKMQTLKTPYKSPRWARADSSKGTRCIDNRNEIDREVGRHAFCLRLHNDEVERQKSGEIDEERTDSEKLERYFGKGLGVLL
jgi:hypothetical protein